MLSAMTAALRVVVLLLSTTPDPAQHALENAARQSLAADTVLEVLSLPDGSEALTAHQSTNTSDALIEVRWSADRLRATLNIYDHTDAVRSQREVEFEAIDLEQDKGQHLGLLIGSLFDMARAPSPEPSARSDAPKGVSGEQAAASKRRAPLSGAAARPGTGRSSNALHRQSVSSGDSTGRASSAWLFEATLSAALAGSGGGVGANFGWGTQLVAPLWWHGSVGAQAGEVPQAQATTQTLKFASGVGLRHPVSSRLELGLRGDALVHWLQVAHLSDDDPVADRQQRWNAGAALVIDAALRVSDNSSVVIGSGMELLIGETQLYTHGRRVATVARERWTTSLGLRLSY
jgi:hypothetical protein